MKTTNQMMRDSHFILGMSFFVVGIVILIAVQNSLRYVGFVFISGALIYLFTILYTGTNDNHGESNFRSRTRQQILKHQHKR